MLESSKYKSEIQSMAEECKGRVILNRKVRGAGVAQSVEVPTPDFSSGHDLMVRGIKPCVWLCADSVEPAWDSLSPPLSVTLPISPSLLISLSNK